MVELADLSFSYKGEDALFSSLDFTFEEGKIHGIIGKSGCGKTTLLYMIAGLLTPGEGRVSVGGIPAEAGRRDISIILQKFGLFPWKRCGDNLALGLKIRGVEKRVIEEKVRHTFKELDLSGKEKRFPSQLSGGEQQRLAIGRALILEPRLLLLDEPFSSLDSMTREGLQDRLLEIKRKSEGPLTIILVTHSIEEAVFLCDRIHIMDGQGGLQSLDNSPGGAAYRKEQRFFETCLGVRRELERISR